MSEVVRLLKELSVDGTVRSVVIEPRCSRCGEPSARIEITPPHKWPDGADLWDSERRGNYMKHRDFSKFDLDYSGPGGSGGDSLDEPEALKILRAFAGPPVASEIAEAFYDGAGFCGRCEKFYCDTHWDVSAGGYGHCPEGHGKSLDPLYSPTDYGWIR